MGIQERKGREKEIRKNQILEAGEKIILSKGLQYTTMDEIAQECELSKGTLYLYFKSKEELYGQVIIKAMDILYNMLSGSQTKYNSIPERMQGIGEAYLDFATKYPAYFNLLNSSDDTEHELCHNKGNIQGEIHERNKKIWSLNVNLIKEGMEAGIFKKDINPYEISLILWSSSNGLIYLINHLRKYKHDPIELEESPLSKVDCEESLFNLWTIIFRSILINPEEQGIIIENLKKRDKEKNI